MRRLLRSTRPLSVLLALWFAAVMGDPGMLHSCPMHSAHGAVGSFQSMRLGLGAHAMHHQAPHGHASPDAPQHHSSGPCTCVGHCCATSIAAPLSIAPTLYVPVAVLAERDPLQHVPSVVPAATALRLPFANGPPAV